MQYFLFNFNDYSILNPLVLTKVHTSWILNKKKIVAITQAPCLYRHHRHYWPLYASPTPLPRSASIYYGRTVSTCLEAISDQLAGFYLLTNSIYLYARRRRQRKVASMKPGYQPQIGPDCFVHPIGTIHSPSLTYTNS